MSRPVFKRKWDFDQSNRPIFLNDLLQDNEVVETLQLAIDAASKGADGEDGDDGEDGRSITSLVRTAGNGAPGTTDIYAFRFNIGPDVGFEVYNGKNGDGAATAANTPFDGTASGLEAAFVQGAIDEVVVALANIDVELLANEIPYDNAASGLSATELQSAVDELVVALADIELVATRITYDGTSSGLTSTQVQDAIDEATARLVLAEAQGDDLDTRVLALEAGPAMPQEPPVNFVADGGVYRYQNNGPNAPANLPANQEGDLVLAFHASGRSPSVPSGGWTGLSQSPRAVILKQIMPPGGLATIPFSITSDNTYTAGNYFVYRSELTVDAELIETVTGDTVSSKTGLQDFGTVVLFAINEVGSGPDVVPPLGTELMRDGYRYANSSGYAMKSFSISPDDGELPELTVTNATTIHVIGINEGTGPAVADRLDDLEAAPRVVLLESGQTAADVPAGTPVGSIVFTKV